MSKHAQCPVCVKVFEVGASGTVKGLGILASLLFGLRLANPWVALGLTAVSLIWGDEIEEAIKARCPECNVALKIVGEAYP